MQNMGLFFFLLLLKTLLTETAKAVKSKSTKSSEVSYRFNSLLTPKLFCPFLSLTSHLHTPPPCSFSSVSSSFQPTPFPPGQKNIACCHHTAFFCVLLSVFIRADGAICYLFTTSTISPCFTYVRSLKSSCKKSRYQCPCIGVKFPVYFTMCIKYQVSSS